MAIHKWDKIDIQTNEGTVKGIAPVIISASRATDIPAFYSEWFINRLRAGYIRWVNPFNGKTQYISFDKARVIVFWTKDARPIIPHLNEIDKKRMNYYFLFTVNDYEKEGLEPGVRELKKRIDSFKTLSEKIGNDKVIWRFDPLILTDKIAVDDLLNKVLRVGNRIAGYTNKLVISFADISNYRRVQINLKKHHINYKEFTLEAMKEMAKGLNELNKNWGLDIATCSEDVDLSRYNIKKNKCIDDNLMIKLFSQDKELMRFLGFETKDEESEYEEISLFDKDINSIKIKTDNSQDRSKKLKDKGQRENCGCIMSKDIGQYDTCNHQCIYCYANGSPQAASINYHKYLLSNRDGESIIY